MEYQMIKLIAICNMLTYAENSRVHTIRSEARPNLLLNDMFFPSRIVIKHGVLEPCGTDEISVDVIVDRPSVDLFFIGGDFSLYDGPLNMLARCHILDASF